MKKTLMPQIFKMHTAVQPKLLKFDAVSAEHFMLHVLPGVHSVQIKPISSRNALFERDGWGDVTPIHFWDTDDARDRLFRVLKKVRKDGRTEYRATVCAFPFGFAHEVGHVLQSVIHHEHEFRLKPNSFLDVLEEKLLRIDPDPSESYLIDRELDAPYLDRKKSAERIASGFAHFLPVDPKERWVVLGRLFTEKRGELEKLNNIVYPFDRVYSAEDHMAVQEIVRNLRDFIKNRHKL